MNLKNLSIRCLSITMCAVWVICLFAGCQSDTSAALSGGQSEELSAVQTENQADTDAAEDDQAAVAVNANAENTEQNAEAPSENVHEYESGTEVRSIGGYAVSSSSSEATAAGIKILEEGGNAVDAAVAVALALAVAEPYSSGLGGGGFMVVYDPEEDTAWSLDYYAASGASQSYSGDVGVPGLLKGMQTALDTWGTKSLSEVIEPAIDYAVNGFKATDSFIMRLSYSSLLQNNPAFKNIKSGDTIVQTALGNTLSTIQSKGIDAFYSGSIASDIADACGLTVSDLKSYQTYLEPAISTDAYGYTLYSSTAPSSGVTTLQMVSMSEKLNIKSPETDTASYMNALRKITLAAYQSRSSTVVDPRCYDFDADELLSDEYLDSLLNISDSMQVKDDEERRCTTQFSVIDSNGMIVCATDTLSDSWGSYTLVDGFYLNDTLSLFGDTEKFGYAPNKRPRTHISPVVAIGEDGSMMAIGSPGGVNIPRVVAPILIDILKFGTDPQTAVEKARAIIDADGAACVETTDYAASMVNISEIPFSYYYCGSHLFFGCTSVVGYSAEQGVFAVSDKRRATSEAEAD